MSRTEENGTDGRIGQEEVLIRVRNLSKHFPIRRGVLRRRVGAVKAVDRISFDIKRGEALSLVGESGCGKSTVGRIILRLQEPTAGRGISGRQGLSQARWR